MRVSMKNTTIVIGAWMPQKFEKCVIEIPAEKIEMDHTGLDEIPADSPKALGIKRSTVDKKFESSPRNVNRQLFSRFKSAIIIRLYRIFDVGASAGDDTHSILSTLVGASTPVAPSSGSGFR
jgi:hypothetical protein